MAGDTPAPGADRRGEEIISPKTTTANILAPPRAIQGARLGPFASTAVQWQSWSPEQLTAREAIGRWHRDPSGEQVFLLYGPAGTGKSTLAQQIGGDDDGVEYLTFTGKAAFVLRRKGCKNADTLDSKIYARPRWLSCSRGCGKPPCRDPCPNVSVHFGTKVVNRRGPLSRANLLIVDEASQVDERIGRDLLSFGKKVLVIGDPYQLPPPKGRGFFTRKKPNILLTEIHRQAAGSPIIQMATTVRNGGWLRHGPRGSSAVVPSIEPRRYLDYDVIIVGLHDPKWGVGRKLINRRIRQLLGFSGPPQVGERLLCTRTSRSLGVMNGEIWTVRQVEGIEDDFIYMAIADDLGRLVNVKVLLKLFENDEAEQPKTMGEAFTWGYCITCHKAQGSEWNSVLVFDQGGSFRDPNDPTYPNRWRYTAITRASDAVTVVRARP